MLWLLAAAAIAPVVERPNIILILSDDHARQAISAYGSRIIDTPGIDRLASEGFRFDRHYTANPICAPSRASLLTGKHSHANGHKDNVSTFDGTQQTFPKLLQQGGYETAAIGKWHLISDPTGFDHWEVLPGQGLYHNPDFLTPKGRHREEGYVTDLVTDKALKWLNGAHDKPFFLMIGHKAPHRNWVPDFRQLPNFRRWDFPEPPTLRTEYSGLVSAAKNVRMRIDQHMRTDVDLLIDFVPPRIEGATAERWRSFMIPQSEEYKRRLAATNDLLGVNFQRYLQNYLRCVASVDESVRRVLDHLDRSGLSKNTLVVYSSDQGFFLGENAWYDKRWFYEPSAGTPLIVRMPESLGRRVRTADILTSNVDLAPTFLELARLPVPADLHGRSFARFLLGNDRSPIQNAVYGHFYENDDPDHKAPRYVAIATERHKLIYYYDLGEWELFDVLSDPLEQKNLWAEPRASQVRSELVRKLIAEQRRLREEPEIIEAVARAAKGLGIE